MERLTEMEQKMKLKAILFDLDGTLLQIDTNLFMAEYLKELSESVKPVIDTERFINSLLASTAAMIADKSNKRTNEEVFWDDFRNRLKDCINNVELLINKFYESEFKKLNRVANHNIFARQLVQSALDCKKRIVLATNPVFPLSAIEERMVWAKINNFPWELVTSYENMHFCKPHVEYYLEIARHLELEPSECLMVGNNVEEDMIAGTIGMQTCLVTDYLIGNDETYKVDWSGPISKLAGWLYKHLNKNE